MRVLLALVSFLKVSFTFQTGLSDLLDQVVSRYYQCNQVTVMADDFYMQSEELGTFLGKLKFPYTIYHKREAIEGKPDSILCKNAVIFMKTVDELREFVHVSGFLKSLASTHSKISFVSSGESEKVEQFLALNTVREFRNLILVNYLGRSAVHEIRTCGNVGENSLLLDRWSLKKGFYKQNSLFPDRFVNMGGGQLRVGTLNYPPYTVINQQSDGSKTYTGIEHEIIRVIGSAMNMTLKYQEPSSNELWGQAGPNVSTGILGMVARGVVDIGVANFYMALNHNQFADFVIPYSVAYECFATPGPKPLPQWRAIYYPFDKWIWVSTFLATVVTLILAWGIANIFGVEASFRQLSSAFIYVAGNLLQVQQHRDVVAGRIRMLLIWFFLFTTIVPTVYRSVLISFFTRPIVEPPIDTMEELANSPLRKSVYGTQFKDVMINSTDRTIRLLGEQATVHFNITAVLSGVAEGWAAASSGQGNLMHEIRTKFADRRFQERIHVMQECIFSEPLTFPLRKKSPMIPTLDAYVQRLIETGIVDYYKTRFQWKVSIQRKIDNRLVPFSLSHVQGAFMLIGVGYGFAFIALVFEMIFHK